MFLSTWGPMSRAVFFFTLFLTFAASLPLNDDTHSVYRRLPTAWYHSADHPVHALFKRGPPGDGTNYAPVGSPAWSSGFPMGVPNATQLPKAWVDALNAAVAAGKIPNIPVSSNKPNTNPVYPQGFDPNSAQVCSSTYKCRNPGDVWDAPVGVFASSFDDGPLPPTLKLVEFLQQQSVITTHFMIGINIVQNPAAFQAAFNAGHHIAVHTWTHPYMTTLSNVDVLGQLGWTAELIRNSTGGRLPKFWRPPYGDSDNRVRAIAKEVFGLTTVIWNQDPSDWSLSIGGTTLDKVQASLQQFITGPKSPGLVILEHELSDQSVQAFINVYPLIGRNNWTFASLTTTINGSDTYQNAHDSLSNVTAVGGVLAGQVSTSAPPISSSSGSSGSSTPTLTSSSKLVPSATLAAKSASERHANKVPLNIIYAVFAIAFLGTFTSGA